MAYGIGLSQDNKIRILAAIELGKTAVHWGWIPAIIYLGLSRTYPRPSLIKLLSPLA